MVNTTSVMHSWRILSWKTDHSLEPMRFAGTWKMYSNNAIPQLARITIQSGWSLNFKCPYQARFMNVFEMVSRMMVFMRLKANRLRGSCGLQIMEALQPGSERFPPSQYGLSYPPRAETPFRNAHVRA